MSHTISRAQFLRGDLRGEQTILRPPWALPEVAFRAGCDGCGACVRACPEGILTASKGRLPQVDFARGRCTFCGACVDACGPGALLRPAEKCSPWPYRAQLGDRCLALQGVVCRSCGEACDEQAIRFRFGRGGVAHPEIEPEGCSGCGGCVRVCPVGAIVVHAASRPQP